MAKHGKHQPQAAKPMQADEPQPSRTIESYRRCPLCWNRCKGYGVAYSSQGGTRYYRCKSTLTDLPPCGHTWTVQVRLEVLKIEHKIVGGLSER